MMPAGPREAPDLRTDRTRGEYESIFLPGEKKRIPILVINSNSCQSHFSSGEKKWVPRIRLNPGSTTAPPGAAEIAEYLENTEGNLVFLSKEVQAHRRAQASLWRQKSLFERGGKMDSP